MIDEQSYADSCLQAKDAAVEAKLRAEKENGKLVKAMAALQDKTGKQTVDSSKLREHRMHDTTIIAEMRRELEATKKQASAADAALAAADAELYRRGAHISELQQHAIVANELMTDLGIDESDRPALPPEEGGLLGNEATAAAPPAPAARRGSVAGGRTEKEKTDAAQRKPSSKARLFGAPAEPAAPVSATRSSSPRRSVSWMRESDDDEKPPVGGGGGWAESKLQPAGPPPPSPPPRAAGAHSPLSARALHPPPPPSAARDAQRMRELEDELAFHRRAAKASAAFSGLKRDRIFAQSEEVRRRREDDAAASTATPATTTALLPAGTQAVPRAGSVWKRGRTRAAGGTRRYAAPQPPPSSPALPASPGPRHVRGSYYYY